jgi:hypothetical protein
MYLVWFVYLIKYAISTALFMFLIIENEYFYTLACIHALCRWLIHVMVHSGAVAGFIILYILLEHVATCWNTKIHNSLI